MQVFIYIFFLKQTPLLTTIKDYLINLGKTKAKYKTKMLTNQEFH